MALQKLDLIHELPEHWQTIHDLKVSDAHFAKLFEEYHKVDKEMHRIEEHIETPSDDYTHQRKIDRLALKDDLYAMIVEHESKSKIS